MARLTPTQIVKELDKYIIGQNEAKRAVAIALSNRERRLLIADEDLRKEIKPKNILLIGPTGVGKTEIARRLAMLADAPFLKIEATKFTEVGYVGRDVESIIRDLMDIAIKQIREQEMAKIKNEAQESAIERVLDILLPTSATVSQEDFSPVTRETFKTKLLNGELDDKEIEIEVTDSPFGVEIMAPPGMEEMTSQLQSLFSTLSTEKKKKRKQKIKDALDQLCSEEAAKRVNDEEIKKKARDFVEQHGIVFIDEIDKITQRSGSSGGEVSREGVQRDLLPLVEGCTVFTKYGMIKTDHILFIASGAFHLSKPSDLIPELQGRFPVRAELQALSVDDFVRILTEPYASLKQQYIALMKTEDVTIKFTKDCIKFISEIAYQVNEKTENIGARRLYTIMERLLEKISFDAPTMKGKTINIDAKYAAIQLQMSKNEDWSRYIL